MTKYIVILNNLSGKYLVKLVESFSKRQNFVYTLTYARLETCLIQKTKMFDNQSDSSV